jgi:hypothetical protein
VNIEEFVRRIRAILEVAGVPYMLTGSLASSIHGIPRATNDIDFVIDPDRTQLPDILQRCNRLNFYMSPEEAGAALASRSQFGVVDFANGWKADLIIRKERPFSSIEFSRRKEAEFSDFRLMIASAEDVVIAKLEWSKKKGGSEQQLLDVAGILKMQGDALDMTYVEKWIEALGLQQEWTAAREKVV